MYRFDLFSVDLSLYKDESQIEKKSIGKRKSADNTKPAAKKQKIHTAKTPAKKATTIAKASQSMSESAKVTRNMIHLLISSET